MPNLHSSGPDTLAEMNAQHYDLLPACIVSSTWPTAPGSGLTLAAFSTQGYVRSGTQLSYVDQPARAVTLPSSAGTYYLALTKDTHSTPGSFTRVPGSHYAYLQSATAPTYPDGTTPIASAVVSGGNITSVDTAPALTPPLSRQTADAVEITGGSVVLTGVLAVANTFQADPVSRDVSVPSRLLVGGNYLGITTRQQLIWDKTSQHGILLFTGSDAGSFATLNFLNASGVQVGSITQTGSGVAYNTVSDVRLKCGVTALTGALAALQALRPVQFRWNSTDESDIGFLAHELMTIAPHAVTGLPDEVNPDGSVKPQQVDQSKLVPILVAAAKELLAQVEALTTRVASLEEQLGL